MQAITYSDKEKIFIVTRAPKKRLCRSKKTNTVYTYIHMASQTRQGHKNIQRASQFYLANTNDIKQEGILARNHHLRSKKLLNIINL